MYILKHTEQKKLLEQLVLTDELDDGWTKKFIDPTTDTEWILYHYHNEMQGGGHKIMRENSVPEKLADWMNLCFSSGDEDDIIGLAWDLSIEHDRWPDILDWLETNSVDFSKPKVSLFLNNLEILHVVNRRPIVGKDAQTIEMDYLHFQQLAQRAENLMEAG